MTIQFKSIGSSGMDLIKDSSGIIWIELTDSVNHQRMPLTNTDISNLITTLEYLKRLQPENLREDPFGSVTIPNDTVLTTSSGTGVEYLHNRITTTPTVHTYNSAEIVQSLTDRGVTIHEDSFTSNNRSSLHGEQTNVGTTISNF